MDVGCGISTFRELRRRERTVLVTGLDRSSTVVFRFRGPALALGADASRTSDRWDETMRNTEMAKLGGLVGEWATKISDAFFLEPPGAEVPGITRIEWLGESLLVVRSQFGGGGQTRSEMSLVLGRSDANDRFVALYEDDRGVCREFAMTFDGEHWTMTREDPDFHQRFIANVDKDRILGRWEASEDTGKSWRKDFDLTFERA
ncbi:hypothetical protein [Micromonospora sediminimaris]|uniref:hypothetical protein n=1 Tax=Micromonospora sediminimaris TaxID=547162 RepID=UPI0008E0ABD9|nr:hypothetical protein [Micromonospora sediminimaris]SFC52760.1 hypothetical protein SAMN05216284_105126 [Micromonospora sediminimaris]